MRGLRNWPTSLAAGFLVCLLAFAARAQNEPSQIGREVAASRHIQNAEEYQLFIPQLITVGKNCLVRAGLFKKAPVEAVLAHSDEALASRQAFESFRPYDRDCLIEFLKTLQVLPPGMANSFIDERGGPRRSD